MGATSVVMATYNGERFLPEQLDSLANQTNPPCELLVFDDASSDRTVDLVRRFASRAPFPVRLFQNQVRIGYRKNFMNAASACSSDLIAFCDQDDVWKADKLETMGKAFSDPNVLLAYHNATVIDEIGTPMCRIFPRANAKKSLAPLTLPPWTVIPGHVQVIRRSLVAFSKFHAASIDPYCPMEVMPHDQWYPFWASVLGHIAYCPASLTLYRQHSQNASGWPYTTWTRFVADHLKNAGAFATGEAIATTNRLNLLQAALIGANDHSAVRIAAAITYHRKFRVLSQNRSAIYNSHSLTERARAFMRVLKSGGYTGGRSYCGGLDTLALDTFVGVPFRRLGRRNTFSNESSTSVRERPTHVEERALPELPSIGRDARCMRSQ